MSKEFDATMLALGTAAAIIGGQSISAAIGAEVLRAADSAFDGGDVCYAAKAAAFGAIAPGFVAAIAVGGWSLDDNTTTCSDFMVAVSLWLTCLGPLFGSLKYNEIAAGKLYVDELLGLALILAAVLVLTLAREAWQEYISPCFLSAVISGGGRGQDLAYVENASASSTFANLSASIWGEQRRGGVRVPAVELQTNNDIEALEISVAPVSERVIELTM